MVSFLRAGFSSNYPRLGLLHAPTHLKLDHYTTLFGKEASHRTRVPHKTYTYRSHKQIWAITRSFSELSYIEVSTRYVIFAHSKFFDRLTNNY